MASYIPNKPTPRPWQTDVQFPGGQQHSRFGAVSSGSTRNMARGYLGGNEGAAGANLTNMLRTNASRFLYYNAAMQHIDSDFDRLGGGRPSATLPAPGTPRIARDADGNQLALGRGPIAMGGAPQHQPFVGPHRPAIDVDSRTQPVQGPAYKGPIGELNAGPRVHAMGTSQAPLPIAQQVPQLLAGPGVARTPFVDSPLTPSARTAGRRAPAGMDPRKRGTWLNHQ